MEALAVHLDGVHAHMNQHLHAFNDITGNHRAKHGHDAAGDGLEEAVPQAVLFHQLDGLLVNAALAEAGDLAHVLDHLVDMGADDNLILPALVHDALDALHRHDRILVGDGVVLQDEPQPGHAVGHVDDIFLTADGLDHVRR
ncbi:MAG: hypothetical protein LUF84_00410 [Clostridiales bacterium]|nr:hypothetical protein [Clostridiales bacterium]